MQLPFGTCPVRWRREAALARSSADSGFTGRRAVVPLNFLLSRSFEPVNLRSSTLHTGLKQTSVRSRLCLSDASTCHGMVSVSFRVLAGQSNSAPSSSIRKTSSSREEIIVSHGLASRFRAGQRGPVIFTAAQPMQCGQRRCRRGRGCRPVSPSYCAPRLPPKGFPKFETSPSPDRSVRGYSGSRPIRCTTKRPSRRQSHRVPSSRHQAKATRSHCRSSDQIGRDAHPHSLCTRSRHRL